MNQIIKINKLSGFLLANFHYIIFVIALLIMIIVAALMTNTIDTAFVIFIPLFLIYWCNAVKNIDYFEISDKGIEFKIAGKNYFVPRENIEYIVYREVLLDRMVIKFNTDIRLLNQQSVDIKPKESKLLGFFYNPLNLFKFNSFRYIHDKNNIENLPGLTNDGMHLSVLGIDPDQRLEIQEYLKVENLLKEKSGISRIMITAFNVLIGIISMSAWMILIIWLYFGQDTSAMQARWNDIMAGKILVQEERKNIVAELDYNGLLGKTNEEGLIVISSSESSTEPTELTEPAAQIMNKTEEKENLVLSEKLITSSTDQGEVGLTFDIPSQGSIRILGSFPNHVLLYSYDVDGRNNDYGWFSVPSLIHRGLSDFNNLCNLTYVAQGFLRPAQKEFISCHDENGILVVSFPGSSSQSGQLGYAFIFYKKTSNAQWPLMRIEYSIGGIDVPGNCEERYGATTDFSWEERFSKCKRYVEDQIETKSGIYSDFYESFLLDATIKFDLVEKQIDKP